MQKLLRFLLCCLLTIIPTSTALAESPRELMAAFIRGGNLWVKTGNLERQATTTGNASDPKWSYDGRWIAYSQNEEIWVYDVGRNKHYPVYRRGGYAYQWAPDKNLLAFKDDSVLNVSDIRNEHPKRFANVALGVDSYSWMPDGKGFLASSSADLHPDGWTNPILYQIPLASDLQVDDLVKDVQKFFIVPTPIKKDRSSVVSITASSFRWSPDGKWIAFMVSPWASWSMDENMLCVLSSDGSVFEPIAVMLDQPDWFQWAPHSQLMGYIQGSGRIVFGFKNKNLMVAKPPAFHAQQVTPHSWIDLDFTWQDDEVITVSRAEERAYSNDLSKHPRPSLYQISLKDMSQKKITSPPDQYGDYRPFYLKRFDTLTWLRSNDKQFNVWIASANGENARVWIQHVDGAVSWFASGEM